MIGQTHRPFTDDGVTYCGWDGHDGCGELWPCSTVRSIVDFADIIPTADDESSSQAGEQA
jgi:hypothetical protein